VTMHQRQRQCVIAEQVVARDVETVFERSEL
jgi:hypothetical protein